MNITIYSKIYIILNLSYILISGFTSSTAVFAQVRTDSLEYLGPEFRQNYLSNRFDKQINTFYLNSEFKYFFDSDRFEIRLNENFNSTFIRNPQSSNRDEQHFTFKSAYKYSGNLKLGVLGNSTVLSDNRSLGINQASVSFATLFSEFALSRNLVVSPFGGYSSNSQIGENNYGFVYGLEGIVDNLLLSDFRLNSALKFRNEDVIPRRNLNRYFQFSASNIFDEDITNSINFLYTQNKRDFYFQTDSLTQLKFGIKNNIQSRKETLYSVQDRLIYDRIFDSVSLLLTGKISMRTIDRDTRYKNTELTTSTLFDTKIEELKIDLESISRYTSGIFDAQLRFSFSERDEKNITKPLSGVDEAFFNERDEIESQKNNNSGRISLTFFGDLKFSEKEKLTISFYQSKLKYDTPSEQNDDDRDELLSILRLRYSNYLNPNFEAFISAEGTYSHIVYIFAGRSSNNNVNRIIRLRGGGDYRSRRFSSYNSFEVSANYTVYDFEDLTSNFQSFSFRQMTAIDSTTINLTDRISLFGYGSIKLSEQGDFKWSSFTSRPTRYLQEIYIEPRFILYLNRSQLSVGVRYFSLNTFNFDKLNKIPDMEYSSFGPIVIIGLNLWKRLDIYLNGFYEFIRTEGNPVREQANLIFQTNWKF